MKKLKALPFEVNFNTIDILKKLNSSIGELKGLVNILPNPNLFFNLKSYIKSGNYFPLFM